ncbi:hypothetical protein FHG87_002871 [Trinorchestia longiramus]|nr:hypothetical protein FHG87_002871 [Trinorchestia longiramus]
MARLLPHLVIMVALLLHEGYGLEFSTSRGYDNAEDAPIALTSYGPQARLFLGTSTNTRVVTTTSGTVVICANMVATSACTGRKKRSTLIRENLNIEPVLSDVSAQLSSSVLEPESLKQDGRILFYPATIFTTVTFTAFSDSGTTATVSFACSPPGAVMLCG